MAEDIYEALLEVQRHLPTVAKTTDNPFFKSKYADLETITKAVYPVLHAQDILVIQTPSFVFDRGDALETTLRHVPSGTDVKSVLLLHKCDDSQKQGAAITYARRYALVALLGLVTEPDDDGNAASGKKASAAAQDDTESARTPVAPRRKRAPKTDAPKDPVPADTTQAVTPPTEDWASAEVRNAAHEQMVDRVNNLAGDDVKAVPRKFVAENGWPLPYAKYVELDELVRLAEELGAVPA